MRLIREGSDGEVETSAGFVLLKTFDKIAQNFVKDRHFSLSVKYSSLFSVASGFDVLVISIFYVLFRNYFHIQK